MGSLVSESRRARINQCFDMENEQTRHLVAKTRAALARLAGVVDKVSPNGPTGCLCILIMELRMATESQLVGKPSM